MLHRAYFAALPQGATVTSRAHGLDISKYDLRFTPETATGQLDFVIQRISYRKTRDEAFDTLLPGAMRVPVRGGYHYLSSGTSWREQADAYLSYVSGLDYHFHACDFEAAYNFLSTEFAYQAWQWIHYVASKTGKRTLLYTSPSHYNDFIYPSQLKYGIKWNEVGLWTAQWFFTPNPNATPTMPKGRATWDIWQYTDKGNGPIYGVARPTACDLDVFNGSVSQMQTYFGVTGTTEPPTEPTEGETMQYKVVWGAGVTKRTGPTTSAAPVRDAAGASIILPPNLVFDVVQDGIADQTYPNDANRKWVKFTDGSYGASNYPDGTGPQVRMTKVVAPPPAGEEYILHVKDGVTRKFILE